MLSTGWLLRKSTMSLLVSCAPCVMVGALCLMGGIQFGRFGLFIGSHEAGPLGGAGRASRSHAQDSPDGVGGAGGPRPPKIQISAARARSLLPATNLGEKPLPAPSQDPRRGNL